MQRFFFPKNSFTLKSNTDITSILTREQNINNRLNQDFTFNSVVLRSKYCGSMAKNYSYDRRK